MNWVQLAGILSSVVVAVGVMRANPHRALNRAFFAMSLVALGWQLCLAQVHASSEHVVYWIRCSSAFAALFPVCMWMMKECALGRRWSFATARRGWGWVLVAVGLIALVFTDSFIPLASTANSPRTGWGWLAFYAVLVIQFVALFTITLRTMGQISGLQKVELQILLIGSSATGIAGWFLVIAAPRMGITDLKGKLPFVIMGFYGFMAWAVTSRRVLEARQLFRGFLGFGVELAVTVVLIATGIFVGLPYLPDYVGITLIALCIAFAQRRLGSLRSRFGVVGGHDPVRRELMVAAGETRVAEFMTLRFAELLCKWGKTERAHIFAPVGSDFQCNTFAESIPPEVIDYVMEEGWITPEKMIRTATTPKVGKALDFLQRHQLSALMASPKNAQGRCVFIALGTRNDQSFFTFVDATILEEWSFIIEGALERAHLLQQAQESEQLATAGLLGASLAHEIRNPMVAIKSVVSTAKTRYEEPAFKRLLVEVVPGEIERIERLVEGLMDLGRPRIPQVQEFAVHTLITTTLSLVTPKAKQQKIELAQRFTSENDLILADAAGLRQVLLNLTMNAMDAVSNQEGERKVTVCTERRLDAFIIEVQDNGPGVSEEVRKTLFRPFTTSTKSSGMGLGLAISADIVRAHKGSIRLRPGSGRGASFVITLPC